MAIYRNVHISFWEDNKVVDDFTPKDKLFMLYLLTNPHTNLSGCYEISIKQMVNELGYDARTVKELLKRLEEDHKVIMYSNETKEVLIKNWHKYNWNKSPMIKKPIKDFINKIKDKSFKNYMVSIGYQYGIDTTDTDSDTDTNNILSNIIDYYIKYINITPSSFELEKLKSWIKEFEEPLEIIKLGIDICCMKKVTTMSFLEGILRNWKNAKLVSLEKIKQHENQKNNFEENEFKVDENTQKIFDYDWLNDSDTGDFDNE